MTQHYKPQSYEEIGLKGLLGDQYDYFMEHVETANRRKLYEALEMKPWRFYRLLRIYKRMKEGSENEQQQEQ